MPLSGPQTPGFYLPGAEYFALAPNSTIALGGRRRYAAGPSVTVPAASVASASTNTLIESSFSYGSGIYLHDVWLGLFPADPSSELQVNATNMNLATLSANPAGYMLGSPQLTQLSPAGGQVAIRDQDKLITMRDLLGTGQPNTGQLFFNWQLFFKNNDPTNPHSVQVVSTIIYTRLDGITE